MGYILPYTPFQEIQYQNRDCKFTTRYLHTLPITPLKPNTSDVFFNQDDENHATKKNTHNDRKKISQITGKGLLFDVTI